MPRFHRSISKLTNTRDLSRADSFDDHGSKISHVASCTSFNDKESFSSKLFVKKEPLQTEIKKETEEEAKVETKSAR